MTETLTADRANCRRWEELHGRLIHVCICVLSRLSAYAAAHLSAIASGRRRIILKSAVLQFNPEEGRREAFEKLEGRNDEIQVANRCRF